MKTLSQLNEQFGTNPGNALGVTNHLTPVNNIITNIRNLFAPRLGIVVEAGEDGFSVKIHSSQFVSEEATRKILNEWMYNSCSLQTYIMSQGLPLCKLVNLGCGYVVYFCPNDMPAVTGNTVVAAACHEQLAANILEAEIERLTESALDEEEINDDTQDKIRELIDGDDKVKAAEAIAEIISKKIELPNEYYWKAVKDQEGRESVALRVKSTKKRPFGKKIEVIKSVINIYNSGHDAIWVDPFEDMNLISDDLKTLIENILNILGAEETKDPCIFDLPEKSSEEPEDDSDENEDDDEDNSDEDDNDSNKDDNSDNSDDSNKNKKHDENEGK